MTLFYILTLVVSITILIGLVIFVGIYLFEEPKTYPPDFTDCPDFWKVKPDGTCKIPHPNGKNIGNLKENAQEIFLYTYDLSGNHNDESTLDNSMNSYLSKYTSEEPITDNEESITSSEKLIKGIEEQKGVVYGYYHSDIPHGYDSTNPKNDSINFQDPGWALFGDPYCEIQRWAIRHNIQWDGILNYDKC